MAITWLGLKSDLTALAFQSLYEIGQRKEEHFEGYPIILCVNRLAFNSQVIKIE
jgi:hypothetical protein